MKHEPVKPSPTVTFYNNDNAVGNAMDSIADRQGNNSGKPAESKRGCER